MSMHSHLRCGDKLEHESQLRDGMPCNSIRTHLLLERYDPCFVEVLA